MQRPDARDTDKSQHRVNVVGLDHFVAPCQEIPQARLKKNPDSNLKPLGKINIALNGTGIDAIRNDYYYAICRTSGKVIVIICRTVDKGNEYQKVYTATYRKIQTLDCLIPTVACDHVERTPTGAPRLKPSTILEAKRPRRNLLVLPNNAYIWYFRGNSLFSWNSHPHPDVLSFSTEGHGKIYAKAIHRQAVREDANGQQSQG